MPIRKLCVVLLALLFAGFGSGASAQTATGPEFRVNAETRITQKLPQVAMNARGDFVVAWSGQEFAGGEDSLYARRFAADGTPVTDEIPVLENAFFFGEVAVAVMEDGSFVVVYATYSHAGPGTATFLFEGRRFAADGSPLGGPFAIGTGDEAHNVSAAARPDGGFVVAWEAYRGDRVEISVRIFDADGSPVSNEITLTTGNDPALAVGPEGEFVVVWMDSVPPKDSDEFKYHEFRYLVRGQRFAADGRRQGRRFAVSPADVRFVQPDVAKDAEGNFLVVWAEDFGGLGRGTFGRWYAQDGTPRPGLLRLRDRALPPELAMDARGNFVLAWNDYEDQTEVYGQRFTSGGRPFRPVFRANTITPGYQEGSKVASDAAGNFVVVWRGPDGHGSEDVFARLYRRR